MGTAKSSRRVLTRRIILGTAAWAIGSRWMERQVLADVTNVAPGTGVVQVNLNDYPALAPAFGSIRLDLGGANFYPILVTRLSVDSFSALSTRCAHLGCVVDAFDTQSQRIICPCHGSAYAADGSLINGPARSRLTPYTSEFDGLYTLRIFVPDLGFSVTSFSKLQQPSGNRFKLEFKSEPNANYQVRFAAQLGGASQILSFSRTPSGLASESVLLAVDSKTLVYVDAASSAGFFSVERVVSAYRG